MSIIKSKRGRDFKGPVAWLFGRELLSQLKWILLYTAAGSRFDPRQWMQANIYDYLKEEGEGESIGDEFWFDYLSDTGDGMKATYSIAYLCMSDLYVEDLSTDSNADRKAEREVRLHHKRGNYRNVLPRGQFLFVGGDTSYHLADYETLANRFQTPFEWAYEDLCADLKDTPSDLNVRRPFFGIPANHDYYDEIDGFRRQFRRQVSDEDLKCGICGATGRYIRETKKDLEYECVSCSPPTIIKRPQLQISAFKRCQEASYIAIKLPFGWWLWGLDTERGGIDYRQKDYFLTALKKGGGETGSNNRKHVPDKLIVANSVPIFAFGQLAKLDDEKSTRAYDELDLGLPYHKGAVDPLAAGQCRLDLSGDVHHYARYGGPHCTGDDPRAGGQAPRYTNNSYASVVSGLGGAFHHPSQTYADEIKEQVLYPPENISRAAIAERIFKFRTIWKGGYVGIIGAVIATIFYFGLAVGIPFRGFYNITTFERAREPWLFPFAQGPSLFALSFLALSIVGLWLAFKRVSGLLQTVRKFKASGSRARDGVQDLRRNEKKTIMLLCAITIVTTIAWLAGLYRLDSYTQNISPFFHSIIIFLCLLWAGAAIWLNIRYSDLISHMSSYRNITVFHLVLTWMLWIAVITIMLGGIYLYGEQRFSVLVSDLVLISTLLGLLCAVLYLAISVSGEIGSKMGWPFWLLLGALHLVFQMAVPLEIVVKGAWYVWFIAGVLLLYVFPRAGEYLMKNNISWLKLGNRWWLLIAWVIFGAGIMALTFIEDTPFIDVITETAVPYLRFVVEEGSGKDFTGLIAAFFVGGVTSCVWLGWYLAVSLGFNGHNNEVGGATRIENFKQFVRIRLTRDTLSAYVIAVDEPEQKGKLLKPRIVDSFTLVVKHED